MCEVVMPECDLVSGTSSNFIRSQDIRCKQDKWDYSQKEGNAPVEPTPNESTDL